MKVTNICVLGGTGFVGGHLVGVLNEQGYKVRVLTRRRERHRDLLVLPNVDLVEADVHDEWVLRERLEGMDAVVNLVGILNERGRDGKGFRAVHVELPRKVVTACKAVGVPRLLHMSALMAGAPRAESYYLKTKGEGEDLAHGAADESLAVTSFRPSVIFGPGDSFLNRFAQLLRVSPVLPLACHTARFAPVYVGDVTRAFSAALDNKESFGERLDLCGPHTYTLHQLVEYTAAVLGLRRTIVGLGPTLSRWQANVLEWVPGKPLSRDNFLSLQLDSVCRHDSSFPFGIIPTPLESVAPFYLGKHSQRGQYAQFRARAGRDEL